MAISKRPRGSRSSAAESTARVDLTRRHLIWGWMGLAVFICLGIALEVLHGLKIDFYLDLRNAPRRLLWTLAHTHGTLISLVHLAFAWTATQVPSARSSTASYGLMVALLAMPAGFFVGGVKLYAGDPNLGILLVPVGALAMLVAVVCVVLGLMASDSRGE